MFFKDLHYAKGVRIRSFSSPYFPEFKLNPEKYSVSLRIQSKCGKIWTRKTPNTDTSHAVLVNLFCSHVALHEEIFFKQCSKSFVQIENMEDNTDMHRGEQRITKLIKKVF